ncbi:MAG TPA: hypothetical protein VLX90_12150, partial [Steroidobacteraceae bacterium]|nr:hypothetical protein [Steroidobacteraceae bacterium]
VDRGILLMGDEGIAAGNLKQAYVSNSRFRESQVIFTTSKQEAREVMMRPADRLLAIEMAERAARHAEEPHEALRSYVEPQPRMAVTVG